MESGPKRGANPTEDVLNETFEAALRGESYSLQILLSILKTRYGNLIFARLRRHRGPAHTSTMEDIFQDSVVDFIDQIQSGALAELPESERGNVVRYFQGLCDRKLEGVRKARKDPFFSREKEEVHDGLSSNRRVPVTARLPGVDTKDDQHRELLDREIAALDPFDRLVLDRYLARVPYSEISKETGKKVSTLEALVTRIKQRLAERISHQSLTAKIFQEREKLPSKKTSCLPTPSEILAAIEDLPIEAQNAITFVHLKGGTVDALAQSLGDQGEKMARAQLARGYESLTVSLGVPFPDSFDLLEK